MKVKIYYTFCEYDKKGYSLSTFSIDEAEFWVDESDSYFFLKEVELPEIENDKITKAGCNAIDKNIAELQLQITQQLEKKSQLLAIQHHTTKHETKMERSLPLSVADILVDDILKTSDEDIMNEAREQYDDMDSEIKKTRRIINDAKNRSKNHERK